MLAIALRRSSTTTSIRSWTIYSVNNRNPVVTTLTALSRRRIMRCNGAGVETSLATMCQLPPPADRKRPSYSQDSLLENVVGYSSLAVPLRPDSCSSRPAGAAGSAVGFDRLERSALLPLSRTFNSSLAVASAAAHASGWSDPATRSCLPYLPCAEEERPAAAFHARRGPRLSRRSIQTGIQPIRESGLQTNCINRTARPRSHRPAVPGTF